MSNPNALLLLADHIKLSLLERQRAKTLNLPSDTHDGHIARSLDQFRDGLDALANDPAKASSHASTISSLRKQYDDLTSQFHGFASPAAASTLTSPNDPSLAADFAHAQQSSSSSSPPPPSSISSAKPKPKSVRFTNPSTQSRPAPDLEAQLPPLPHERPLPPNPPTNSSSQLFPYHDDPSLADSAGYRDDAASLDNQQVHEYHSRILAEQDAQLDALGASISRQRELSMQIGDELDSQVMMLDESERVADRHQSRLERARRQVGRITRRGSSESGQMAIIVGLILILVLLIIILK